MDVSLRRINYLLFRGKYPGNWERKSEHSATKKTGGRVIFMCDGFKGHGGFTDRIRGLLATYVKARKLNKVFKIHWTHPFNLENYLEPASYDWKIGDDEISYNYSCSFPLILDIGNAPFKNRIRRLIFRHGLRDRRDVLVYSNIMAEKGNSAVLFNELFRPSERLQKVLDTHFSRIGNEYVSFTFRFGNLLGDFRDIVGRQLGENEKRALINNCIMEFRRCASEIPDGFRILVTSDSLRFLCEVEDADHRVYVVKEKPMHPDHITEGEITKDTWLKTFIDFFMIKNASEVYLFRTGEMYNSSFPMFAAQIGNKNFKRIDF